MSGLTPEERRQGWAHGDHYCFEQAVAERIVAAREAAAAEQARAEGWDEGYVAGFDNGNAAGRGKPNERYDNPYRAEVVAACCPYDEPCGGPGGPCRHHGGVPRAAAVMQAAEALADWWATRAGDGAYEIACRDHARQLRAVLATEPTPYAACGVCGSRTKDHRPGCAALATDDSLARGLAVVASAKLQSGLAALIERAEEDVVFGADRYYDYVVPVVDLRALLKSSE